MAAATTKNGFGGCRNATALQPYNKKNSTLVITPQSKQRQTRNKIYKP